MKLFLHIVILSTLAISVSYLGNEYISGSLKNEANLAREVMSPQDSLYKWQIADRAPFKYRVLFKSIIQTSYQLLTEVPNNRTFFKVYKFWSIFFLLTTVVIFYFFMKFLKFRSSHALFGAMLLVFCPPIFMAYSLPVHTREDMLAYTILLLGIISIMKDRPYSVLACSIAGVLCRETLLIIPFIYLFFSKSQHFVVRATISSLPILLFIALRIVINAEYHGKGIAEGLMWNLSNLSQVAGFLFITFGFLWGAFFISLVKDKNSPKNINLNLLYRSAPAATILVLVTTFLGGIFNEIRLLFLLFPWVLPISCNYFRINRQHIKELITSYKYHLFIAILLIIFTGLTLYSLNVYTKFIPSSIYKIPFKAWVIVAMLSLFSTTILLPIFYITLKIKAISTQ